MTDLDDFIKRKDVHEVSGDTYDSWNTAKNDDFKKGAYIIGILVEKRHEVGKNKQNLYVIEKQGGERVSVWGTDVIDTRLSNKQIGQEMAIVYNGKRKSEKTGREYHDYSFHFAEMPELTVDEVEKIMEEV